MHTNTKQLICIGLLLFSSSFASASQTECRSFDEEPISQRAQQLADQANEEYANFHAPSRGRETGQVINKHGFYTSLGSGAEGEFTRSLTGYTVGQVYNYWRTLDQIIPKSNGLSHLAYPTYENAEGVQVSYKGPAGEDYFPSLATREFRDWDPDTQGRLRLAFVDYAWSAAFISSTIFRGSNLANNSEFIYSMNHRDYINEAIRQNSNRNSSYAFRACDPFHTKARVGDLICYVGIRNADGTSLNYSFERLSSEVLSRTSPNYAGHCDVVVAVNGSGRFDSTLETVGGNVGNSVTRRYLQLTLGGVLERMYQNAPPMTRVLRPNDQNWAVLLQAK